MRSAASGSKCFSWSLGITIAVLLFTLGLFAQAPQTPPASTPAPPAANGNPDAATTPETGSNPQAPTSGPEPVGQEPSSNDQGMFVFKKQVQEVVLHATVLD